VERAALPAVRQRKFASQHFVCGDANGGLWLVLAIGPGRLLVRNEADNGRGSLSSSRLNHPPSPAGSRHVD
jgi:hypothetical protein